MRLMKTPSLLGLCLIITVLSVAPAAAYEALSGRSFYTDETHGDLLFVDVDPASRSLPMTADVLLRGRLLVEGADVVRGRQLSVAFPLASLPQGESELTCRLYEEGNSLGQVGVTIRRLPPRAHVTKIDRLTGGLIVDGLPFLPFGFYCYSPVQPTLAEEEVVRGFNVMSPYQSNDPATRHERRAYMDRAAELGMKVHFQLLSVAGGGGVSLGIPADTSSARREAWLREEVEAFRDHPALLAWYISDEPTGHGATAEQLQRSYDIVHELDPYHPATIVFVNPGKAVDFASAMDLAMVDPYPIPNGPPASVVGAVRALVSDLTPEIPVWIVPQAFGGSEWWTREPTGPELRLMSWLGLMEGATGTQYFIRHGLSGFPKSPVTWAAASRVALEAAALTPFLLSAEAPPEVVTEEESGILAATWRHDGQVVVAAANTRNRPATMRLELPDLSVTGDAEVLFEERSLALDLDLDIPGPLDLISLPLGLVTGILRRSPAASPPGASAAVNSDITLEESLPPYGVRLYRLHEATEKEERLTVNPLNRTIDPSFEWDASASVPAALYAGTGEGRGGTYFVDSRVAFHGRRSVRLHTARAGEGVVLRPYSPRVEPDRSYRLSVWARAATDVGTPTLHLATSMGVADSIQHRLTTQWRQYHLDARAGTGADRAGLSLSLRTPGTAWVDLVEFYDISPRIISTPSPQGDLRVMMESFVRDAELRYEVNGPVHADSPLYTGLVSLTRSSVVQAGLFREGQALSTARLALHDHAAVGRFVDLAAEPSPRYPGDGARTLTDAVLGGDQFNDPRWIGFEGTDFLAVVDLGRGVTIERVAARFFQNTASWIWLPRRLSVEVSADGEHFVPFAVVGHDVDERAPGNVIRELSAVGDPIIARFVRVHAESVRECPDWHPGAGGPAWVFIDEIQVNPTSP